jgi:predicted nucleotidyltransferase
MTDKEDTLDYEDMLRCLNELERINNLLIDLVGETKLTKSNQERIERLRKDIEASLN